jgi:predicted nucleic acid-binding Zn ribbon protein
MENTIQMDHQISEQQFLDVLTNRKQGQHKRKLLFFGIFMVSFILLSLYMVTPLFGIIQ